MKRNGRRESQRQKIDPLESVALSMEEAKLLAEVNEVLDHPQAAEVLLSGWLHHEDIPRPSINLILYLGWRLMHDLRISKEAATLDRDSLATRIIEIFRSESAETRLRSIRQVSSALEADKMEFTESHKEASPFVHEWILLIGDFLYPSDPWGQENIEIVAGQRALARGIIESLVFRSIMRMDDERMEGLAQALRIVREGKRIVSPRRSQIAAGILRATPYLHDRLGRPPTKTEVKTLLLNAFPDDYTDHLNTWADAFRIVGFSGTEDRKRIMDSEQILKLARELAEDCAR